MGHRTKLNTWQSIIAIKTDNFPLDFFKRCKYLTENIGT
jgi:hypothetical protein